MTKTQQLGGHFFIDEEVYISPTGKIPTGDEVEEELIRRKYTRMAISAGDPKIKDFADAEIKARRKEAKDALQEETQEART